MGLLGAGLLAAPTRRPNIIFFLSDDVGIDLISCYGSDRYKTPNIDALAKGGVRFEACHSAPLCGPARCEIMTGRYAFRTGGLTNNSWRDPAGIGAKSKDEISIARLLKQSGYATCSAGKWRQMGETPGAWGFNEWLTDNTAAGWYWQKSYEKNGKQVQLDHEVYCPDLAHEFAMDFMRRNREKPFFIYYPTHLVHGPILRTPDTKEGKDLYADNMVYMDKLLGKVVAEVDKAGLRENTLIVFSGDNGTARQSYTIRGRQINGYKGTMMEGGVRVPLIYNWPGTAPAGKVLNDLTDFSDCYPTFAEVAGVKLPAGVKIDGHSLAPQIRGEKGKPREWVYVQLGTNYYVKDHGWKLNQGGELYDMKQAPFEEKLVAANGAPADAVQARQRLQRVLDELNPMGGKVEQGGSGRRARKKKKAK